MRSGGLMAAGSRFRAESDRLHASLQTILSLLGKIAAASSPDGFPP
jgi:hypothetical protein